MFIFLQTFFLFCFKHWIQHLKCSFAKKKMFEATSFPNPFFCQFFKKFPVDLHKRKQLPGVIVLAKIKKTLVLLRLIHGRKVYLIFLQIKPTYSCQHYHYLFIHQQIARRAFIQQTVHEKKKKTKPRFSSSMCKCFLKALCGLQIWRERRKNLTARKKVGSSCQETEKDG